VKESTTKTKTQVDNIKIDLRYIGWCGMELDRSGSG
jgi:hypothetical protein